MIRWLNELAEVQSLDGEWTCTLHGQTGRLNVPGCWEAQGFDRRADGPAIIERAVAVPAGWAGKHVQIQFEAVSYYAKVEINGKPVGAHTGSWSPFALDITSALRPGKENHIRLTVFKPGGRFPVRESLAGFLPDVALMFGGIWQSARLVAFSGPGLGDIQIGCGDPSSGRLTVSATARQDTGLEALVQVSDPKGNQVASWQCSLETDSFQAELVVDHALAWTPEQPALYTLEIRLLDHEQVCAVVRQRFGFRALTHDGPQLLLNANPICLRGVLNWGWYPEMLCPAPDEATIREEFRRARALGFNLVKLCLYVPSPLYFEIADEVGMLLWLELPMWLPEVTPRLRQQAPLEYADILRAVHHHPSVVLYSLGCELSQAVDGELLAALDGIVRSQTSGVLVCDNSGSGEAYGGLSFDFADFNDYHFYCDLQYFDPLVDHFSRDWRPPRPWILGEFCDADDYRDLDEIEASSGGTLPWWLTEWNPLHSQTFLGYPAQRERMRALGLDHDGQTLERLSRRQSVIIRKTILEKVRARAGMGGYVVTGLRDTPLATSGIFEDLGCSKYPTALFRAFNADSVLLLGRGRARRWTNGGDRPAPFEPYCFAAGEVIVLETILSHTGDSLPGGTLAWEVSDASGNIIASNEHTVSGPLNAGLPRALAHITFDAPESGKASWLSLSASLSVQGHGSDEDQAISNTWTLWTFPRVDEWPAEIALLDPASSLNALADLGTSARPIKGPIPDVAVLITAVWNDDVLRFLHAGGQVLLLQQGSRPFPARPCPFWREAIKLIEPHPVMAAFPHNDVVDLQFYGLATDWVIVTDRLSEVVPELSDFRPLLRRLDARQFTLGDYLFEARVGAGRLMASTLRFGGGLGDQPLDLADNLAGRWLLKCLLDNLIRT